MANPRSKEVRLFIRCANQRLEEATVLLGAEFATGAVYLAGYGVECALKALILSLTPASRIEAVLGMFRGNKAHDYNQLKSWYRQKGGTPAPEEVNRAFTLVQDWSTGLRYSLDAWDLKDALGFLRAAKTIVRWADGRL